MVRTVALAFGLLLAALVAACGGGNQAPADGASAATGPGLTVRQALDSDLDGPLLVNGFLVTQNAEVRLCSALAESDPPRCAGDSLTVEGADLSSIDGLRTEGGVSWTAEPVQLLGEVKDGVLTVRQDITA